MQMLPNKYPHYSWEVLVKMLIRLSWDLVKAANWIVKGYGGNIYSYFGLSGIREKGVGIALC